jgi:hypothetical protein
MNRLLFRYGVMVLMTAPLICKITFRTVTRTTIAMPRP